MASLNPEVLTDTTEPAKLATVAPAGALALPAGVAESARRIVEEGTAAATLRARRGDLAYFAAWASARGFEGSALPVPVAVVVAFVVDHVNGPPAEVDAALVDSGVKAKRGPHSLATIGRRLASLSKAHSVAKLPNPCASPEVRELMKTSRRRAAKAGERPAKKAALTAAHLDRMLAPLDRASLRDARDRAILLLGFASGGRRRSEIAAARVEDLQPVTDGYLLTVRTSKTDQAGEGHVVPVLGRAGRAVAAWLELSGIESGPLFRGVDRWNRAIRETGICGRTVARIVKARAEEAGLDASLIGGHSLRSGFVTEAGRRGHHIREAMALSGHRSMPVALGYYRVGDAENNPTARLMD